MDISSSPIYTATPESLDGIISLGKREIDTAVNAFIQQVALTLLGASGKRGIIPQDIQTYTGPEHLGHLDELISISLQLVEEMWTQALSEVQQEFIAPKLVLFEKKMKFGEHTHTTDMGPCYSPYTRHIYLDPLFFENFRLIFYPGCEDATILLVIAHEMAHYIQDLYFEETQVRYMHEGTLHERELTSVLDLSDFSLYHHFDSSHQANQIVELHADFLAGVCLRRIHETYRDIFHRDDFFEVTQAALVIGDDMMLIRSGNTPTPETYHHGRGDQRALAVAEGYHIGNPFHFTIEDIADIFFREGVRRPAHESVDMFEMRKEISV